MASLDDILSSLKNAVVALNYVGQQWANYYTLYHGTPTSSVAATTAVSTIYTVPSISQFLLTEIDVCNTSASAGTFTVYLVPVGGTASASNALFSAQTIAANTAYQWKGAIALPASSTIQALASATAITFHVSGSAV